MIEIQGQDTGKPVQLILPGFLAPEGYFRHNQARFPELDVWRIFLGDATDLVDHGKACGEALRPRLAGRKASVIGVSAGCILALALPRDLVAGFLLIEPPLRPGKTFVDLARIAHPDERAQIRSLFGATQDGIVEPKDFMPLLSDLPDPTRILAGSERPVRGLRSESVIDQAMLDELQARTDLKVSIYQDCGHYLFGDEARFVAEMKAFEARVGR